MFRVKKRHRKEERETRKGEGGRKDHLMIGLGPGHLMKWVFYGDNETTVGIFKTRFAPYDSFQLKLYTNQLLLSEIGESRSQIKATKHRHIVQASV